MVTVLPIILVVGYWEGRTITKTANSMDKMVIETIANFFLGKGHEVLGTREIHAGIRKTPTKVNTRNKRIKYPIMVAPTVAEAIPRNRCT